MEGILENSVLPIDLILRNRGMDPSSQIRLATDIANNLGGVTLVQGLSSWRPVPGTDRSQRHLAQ